ncbi:uracil-xanthine permease family protein [Polaribacter sp. Z014]|uniref:uracil-xanthine permease family protein n=1 Tax=unclassified Polaribacter TaxID=196858 RepID=UPI00193BB9D9|nr:MULTISPECIES: uracil-xanthine permease family protein [unclassified Polaribacter]MCL7763901.1 uracil-xanthine permease family protein [Polaribacter sp. Z014]QVY66448.1 uracil-xanthine permease [Polaribacter sp. Q13]
MQNTEELETINLDNPIKRTLVGIQFLFVAFGATVLVPLLIDIDPSVALFTAGVGTLIFHLITKGKVPVFLGSSFAFIAPIIAATKLYGYAGTLGGLIAVGLVYGIVSAIIKLWGLRVIERIFPSIVVGPVIMIIGLSLAPVGVNMAKTNWLIALSVLVTAIVIVIYSKGLVKLIPIFIGIVVGYLISIISGLVDFSSVNEAAWFVLPKFTRPEFNWGAIIYMIPVAIAPIIEHIGDMYAIGGVANKKFVKDPGLHRTLLGDGVATAFAGFLGGPPNTTYSEVTGAVALTKIVDPRVLRISAVTAIVFSLVGKISAVLKTIPEAVLGGIMLLLFGMIASIGIKTLVDAKTDFGKTRNQVIVSIILTIGIGGAEISYGNFSLAGIGLASIVGVLLNLILPNKSTPIKGSHEE